MPTLKIRDFIQVHIKPDKSKYRKWLSTIPISAKDFQKQSVKGSGSNGKEIISAFEDTLHTLADIDLATIVSETKGTIDDYITDIIEISENKSIEKCTKGQVPFCSSAHFSAVNDQSLQSNSSAKSNSDYDNKNNLSNNFINTSDNNIPEILEDCKTPCVIQ